MTEKERLTKARHDCRQPLQVIAGNAEILLLATKDESQVRRLNKILDSVQRIVLLLNDIREAGK